MVDFESWKKAHETPTEWRVRKAFLQENADKLDRERLECLSNCFTNSELYGVVYPDKVMKEIQQLGKGIMDRLKS